MCFVQNRINNRKQCSTAKAPWWAILLIRKYYDVNIGWTYKYVHVWCVHVNYVQRIYKCLTAGSYCVRQFCRPRGNNPLCWICRCICYCTKRLYRTMGPSHSNTWFLLNKRYWYIGFGCASTDWLTSTLRLGIQIFLICSFSHGDLFEV